MIDQLKAKFAAKALPMRDEIKSLIKNNGNHVLGEYTVAHAYGGMKGIISMITETSKLDPEEGIRFRGYSIPELKEKLPKAPGGKEPLPEGLFYLLLIGELPTEADVNALSKEFAKRGELSESTKKVLDSLPIETHPMTQLSIGLLSCQKDSVFAAEYRKGMNKKDYWESTFEDVINVIAKMPRIAAYIYRRTYKNNQHIDADPNLDLAGNFAQMLGFDSNEFKSLMRIYLTIHADHEGGNVSAHTTHLVGSALSDAYLSLSAGLNGLAGPLHGLANQEVVRWIMELKEKVGSTPTKEQIKTYLQQTLDEGKVIPGYGHAVLRKTDPRYMAQREFALEYMPDDENFKIVGMIYDVAPDVLRATGKVKNPWPNVDAHSGILLIHYGLVESDFYTVMFGVSRAIGVLTSLVWDRALMSPIERPKSVTTEWIKSQVTPKAQLN